MGICELASMYKWKGGISCPVDPATVADCVEKAGLEPYPSVIVLAVAAVTDKWSYRLCYHRRWCLLRDRHR